MCATNGKKTTEMKDNTTYGSNCCPKKGFNVKRTVCVIPRWGTGSKVPGTQEAEAERNTQLKSVWAALLWLLLFSQVGDLTKLKNAGLEQEPLDDILNITEAR